MIVSHMLREKDRATAEVALELLQLKRQTGQRIHPARLRAYALTNFKEYFSELTEAYFGKNDFSPFVRAELRTYDPQGYAAIKAAWRSHRVPQ